MQESQSVAGSMEPAGTRESTLPVETAGSIPPAETAELAAPEIAGSTPPGEAAESTPHTEIPELAPHAATTESNSSLTEVRHPAVVDVAIANGDTAISTSDALQPSDPLASIPREVNPHPVPRPSLLQNQLTLPVLFQNGGRQSAQVDVSNGICNGHGTTIENGVTDGVRSEASYNSLWQMLPLASPMVFPHGLHADPLRNELARIKQQEDILQRRYEAKVCVLFCFYCNSFFFFLNIFAQCYCC
jgi:hypothetical protein